MRMKWMFAMKMKIGVGIIVLILFGCATIHKEQQTNCNVEPEECPIWKKKIPTSTAAFHFFIGGSDKYVLERDARNNAMLDAINQFAAYCGVEIKLYYEKLLQSAGKSSEVRDPYSITVEQQRHIVNAFVSRVKATEYCDQKFECKTGTTFLESYYQTIVLATVPVDEIENVRQWRCSLVKPPRLDYRIESGSLYLVWDGVDSGLRDIEVYRWHSGQWGKIDTIRNTTQKDYVLNSYNIGDSFKLRTKFKLPTKDAECEWMDSNVVKVEKCAQDRSYDTVYLISRRTSDNSDCFKKFVRYFENALISQFETLGKTYKHGNARCPSDADYHFSIYAEPYRSRFKYYIKELTSNTPFSGGTSVYVKNGRCTAGIDSSDKMSINGAIENILPSMPTGVYPKTPYPLLCPDNSESMSLSEAEDLCQAKKARIITKAEWSKNQGTLRPMNQQGEYVENGRFYYDQDHNQWQYEEIYQPGAYNPYCVRCTLD